MTESKDQYIPTDVEMALLDSLADEALLEHSERPDRVPLSGEIQDQLAGQGAMGFTVSPSGEKVILYNTYDGTPSWVLKGQLKAQFRKVHAHDHPTMAGKRLYSWNKPADVVEQAQHLYCPLHPQSPQFAAIRALGGPLAQCVKANLPSDYHVQRHMELKHPNTWKLLQAQKAERERVETLEMQRAMLQALGAKVGK